MIKRKYELNVEAIISIITRYYKNLN